jgi:hypothetical protein
LAKFYAKNERMDDVDEVLHRVSENLVKEWGVGLAKSISHIFRVTEMYHGWSRSADALTMTLRAVQYFSDPPTTSGTQLSNSEGESSTARGKSTGISRVFTTSEIRGSKLTSTSVELELVIANARVQASDKEAEPMPIILIEQGQKYPKQFAVQIFKALLIFWSSTFGRKM